ncbi:MAG TPA: sigma-54 dependent transcriptional regulator [Sphingomonas sp.]|nr:sigma-54 dependent transcriptional regulator [Sphingomonas sp.]
MTPNGAQMLMLVDGDPAQLRLVSALAQRGGWRTVSAAGEDMALARLASRDGQQLDAVLIDHSVGDVTPLIAAMRAKRPDLPIVALTANSSVETAVAAMRAGASDFLVKPVAPDRLLAALAAAVESGVHGGELRPLTEKFSMPLAFGQIVGNAPKFRAALEIAAKAASADVPVLIEGEPGVGKATVADAIHHASPRAEGPLVTVDCAAVPANGVESLLFGHEMGAFPGAFTRNIGKICDANGGTLVLDEACKLPNDAQAKLLHLIDHGEVVPIGGRPIPIDVRIVALANCPLTADVQQGKFREDLFYRLAKVQLTLPPLRERLADLPALVIHMLTRIAREPGLRALTISDNAVALLSSYGWPGNSRQLYNALFRAAVFCEGDRLDVEDFPHIAGERPTSHAAAPVVAQEGGMALLGGDGHFRPLEEIEADVIRAAVNHYHGRMTEVARRLGIGRSTLYRKLAELGISDAA